MSDREEKHGSKHEHRQTERKKQVRKQLLVLFVLFVLVSLGAGYVLPRVIPTSKRLSPEEFFGLSSEEEIAVIVDGRAAEQPGRMIGGRPYIDIETVSTYVNPAFYYDVGAELVIVTGPTEVHTCGLSADGEAVLADGHLFLELDFVKNAAAGRFTSLEDPQRLVIRTNRSLRRTELVKDAPVRVRAGIRSRIVRDGRAGEQVYILDEDEAGEPTAQRVDGWIYIGTQDGFSGYVRKGAVSGEREEETPSEPEPLGTRERTDAGLGGEKVELVFHQTTSRASNDALAQSLQGVSGINVLAPTWFFFADTAGTVDSLASEAYVQTAHRAGLKVWAVLNDFDGAVSSYEETAELLSSFEARTAVIGQATDEAGRSGADGICVDIELVRSGSAGAYLEFLRELSAACTDKGLVLSVCTYVPVFTKYLNRTEQARVADYVITMCYDEHTSGSETAGSVSSAGFVRSGLRQTLSEVPEEQLIAALPFFTRLWQTTGDGRPESRAYGMAAARQAAEELGLIPVWDEKTEQYYAEKTEGETTYQIWFEDAESLGRKMEIIAELDCAGVAAWKLGLETEEVWDVLAGGLSS